MDAGELDAGVNAARLARTIEALLGGSLLSWAFYQEGSAARWVRADLDAVLAPYLPATKPKTPRTPKRPQTPKKKAPAADRPRPKRVECCGMRPHQRVPLIVLTLIVAALVFAVAVPTQPPALAADRPNIIFIMSDDHAAHAISAYGSQVNQTPHLDRLAREGALLTNVFVTNSICTPSRAAILTGQYSHLNGVTVFNRFDSSRKTVAKLLQAGGYHTGMIGKWHLGSDPAGFDHWEILPGQGAYVDPVLYTATGEKTYTGKYVTDVITDLGIEFIRSRPREKPFFLMLHHKAPHRPWEPDQAHRRAVRGPVDSRARDAVGWLRRRGRMRCTRISRRSRRT